VTDTHADPGPLKVILSLMLAMILRIIPLKPDWAFFNPDWVALVLLVWILSIPERVGVLRAWGIGLIVDALTGRLLGQHALAYGVMAYLGLQGKASLTVLRKPVQALWILGLLLLGQLLILWTEQQEIPPAMALRYWLPSFTGALLWPLIRFVLTPKDPRALP
jgi:rod shape-determining protein MreD